MAEGFALADAFVRIRPTATGFRAEATAEIKAALAGIKPEVNVGASTAAAQLKIAALQGLLSNLARKVYSARLVTDDARFQAQLARDQALLTAINRTIAKPEIDLLGAMNAEAQLLGIAGHLDKINATISTAHIAIDDADLERRLALLTVQLAELGARAYQIRINADPRQVVTIDRLITGISQLSDKVSTIDFNVIGIDQLAVAEQKFQELNREIGVFMPSALNRAGQSWFRWAALTNRVTLFGGFLGASGILGSIAVWHILADAIIEVVAVLGPAALAFGAFAVAAADSARNVVANIRAISTVSAATHVFVNGLGASLNRLETAMAPHVYLIFGAALQVINNRMGLFSQLAQGAAGVMDNLAARAERAITSSSFQSLLAHAVTDLAKIGDIIGNLFGIFGNLIKMITDWARVLLEAVDVATRALENFTALPVVQTIGRWVIGAHGFWVWVGLLTTAVAGLIPGLARMTGLMSDSTRAASGFSRVKGAAQDLGTGALVAGVRIDQFAQRMIRAGFATRLLAGAEEGAGIGTKLLAGGVGALVSIPVWGWVAAGVVALGILGYALISTKTKTQQWVDSLQQVIDRSSWANVTGTITTSLARVNEAVANSAKNFKAATVSVSAYGVKVGSIGQNLTGAIQQSNDLRTAQQQLGDQLNIAGFRLGAMAAKYGGLRNAMGLAILAGIKVQDLLHANANEWALDLEKIDALIQGYRQMGIGAGALGNSVKVLEVTTNDQITNVQRLTQAWTQFFQIVSGGESTFVSFAQQMLAVKQAMSPLSTITATTSNGLARFRTGATAAGAAANNAGASLTGLNAASLQLRSTWIQAIGAAQTYYNALQTQSAAATDAARGQALLHRAGADLIRILAPAARGSDVMKQAIFALAQQFGFSAAQMQRFITHAGTVKKNEQDLQKVNDILARSVSNVGRDWAQMATTLSGMVKNALEQVAFSSTGATKQAAVLADTLRSQGPASQAAHNAYVKLVTDLRESGLSAQQANDYVAAFTKGMGFNAQTILNGAGARAGLQGDTRREIALFQTVQGLVAAYSNGLTRNWAATAAGRSARAQLIADLIATGEKAHLSQGAIANMIAEILKIPKSEALKLLMTGTGHFSILGTSIGAGGQRFGGRGPGTTGGGAPGVPVAATGMRVPGTGNRDSFLAALTPGEAVVPKHLVPHVAPFLAAHRVPGFASGGFAGSGTIQQVAPPAGAWAFQQYVDFKSQMISSMEAAMKSAAAAAAAAAAATRFMPGASRFGGSSAALAFARANLPAGWSWDALFRLWMQESGWNPYAVNPTSGAYGIPQSLGHGHPFALGDYANQIRWGFAYIRGRYGNSQNAWAHEVSAGWYDHGGWLPPGLSMAYNGTGRPEPVGAAASGTVNINVKVDPVIAAVTPDIKLGQMIGQHLSRALQSGMILHGIVKPK